jgi:hypothetical protein
VSAEPVHYFIYYRIADDGGGAASAVLRRVFTDIERLCGITGRLLHRADEPSLWMEIYEGVRDCAAFDAAMQASLVAHDFESLLGRGAHRIVERFVAGAGP